MTSVEAMLIKGEEATALCNSRTPFGKLIEYYSGLSHTIRLKFENVIIEYDAEYDGLSFYATFDTPDVETYYLSVGYKNSEIKDFAYKFMRKFLKEIGFNSSGIKEKKDYHGNPYFFKKTNDTHIHPDTLSRIAFDILEDDESKKVNYMLCYKILSKDDGVIKQEWHEIYFKDNYTKRKTRMGYKCHNEISFGFYSPSVGSMMLVRHRRISQDEAFEKLGNPLPPIDKFGIYKGATWTTINYFDERYARMVPFVDVIQNLNEFIEKWDSYYLAKIHPSDISLEFNIEHFAYRFISTVRIRYLFCSNGKYRISKNKLLEILKKYEVRVSDNDMNQMPDDLSTNRFIDPYSVGEVMSNLREEMKAFEQ